MSRTGSSTNPKCIYVHNREEIYIYVNTMFLGILPPPVFLVLFSLLSVSAMCVPFSFRVACVPFPVFRDPCFVSVVCPVCRVVCVPCPGHCVCVCVCVCRVVAQQGQTYRGLQRKCLLHSRSTRTEISWVEGKWLALFLFQHEYKTNAQENKYHVF